MKVMPVAPRFGERIVTSAFKHSDEKAELHISLSNDKYGLDNDLNPMKNLGEINNSFFLEVDGKDITVTYSLEKRRAPHPIEVPIRLESEDVAPLIEAIAENCTLRNRNGISRLIDRFPESLEVFKRAVGIK